MEHHVREQGGLQIVAFEGDVDLENSPAARAVLLEAVERGSGVLVDLSGVGYMDSSGVASLVEAYQESKKRGARFALVAVNPPALRVLELARLDRVFTVHASLEEALG